MTKAEGLLFAEHDLEMELLEGGFVRLYVRLGHSQTQFRSKIDFGRT